MGWMGGCEVEGGERRWEGEGMKEYDGEEEREIGGKMRTGCGPSSLSAPSALPTLHTPGDPPGTLPSLSLPRRPFTTSFHFPTRPLTTHHPFLCFFFSFFFSFSFFFLLPLFLVYFLFCY